MIVRRRHLQGLLATGALGLLGPALPRAASLADAPRALSVVRPEDHGAVGDGIADDTAALDAAIRAMNGLPGAHLELRPGRTYLARRSLEPVLCPVVAVSGSATLRLADEAIVNTDEGFAGHAALLDFRGPRWLLVEGLAVDGNRDGQSYPPGRREIHLGSGRNGYRDNALLRVTARDEWTAAGRIVLSRLSVHSAYLNGIALIECDEVAIEDCEIADTTWNGVALAAVAEAVLRRNRFRRVGMHRDWTTAQKRGDRGAIQARARPANWTSAEQGYPLLAAPRANGSLTITDNEIEASSVIGIYTRAVRRLTVERNELRAPGSAVGAEHPYFPGGIWCEWVVDALIADNTVETAGATAKPVDGIVCSALNGPGRITGLEGDPVPLQGPGRVEVVDNTVTGSSGSLHRGIRVNSGVTVRDNRVQGASVAGVLFRNDVSFDSQRLRSVHAQGNRIESAGSGIALEEFSGGKRLSGDCVARIVGNELTMIGGGPSEPIGVRIAPALARARVTLELHGNAIGGTLRAATGLALQGDASSRFLLHDNEFRDLARVGTIQGGAAITFAENRLRACDEGLRIEDAGAQAAGAASLLVPSEGGVRRDEPCSAARRSISLHDNRSEGLATSWLATVAGCGAVDAVGNRARAQSER